MVQVILTILVIDNSLQRHGLLKLDGVSALGDRDGQIRVFAVGIPYEVEEFSESPGYYETAIVSIESVLFSIDASVLRSQTDMRVSLLSTLADYLAVFDPGFVYFVHVETGIAVRLDVQASSPGRSVVVQ